MRLDNPHNPEKSAEVLRSELKSTAQKMELLKAELLEVTGRQYVAFVSTAVPDENGYVNEECGFGGSYKRLNLNQSNDVWVYVGKVGVRDPGTQDQAFLDDDDNVVFFLDSSYVQEPEAGVHTNRYVLASAERNKFNPGSKGEARWNISLHPSEQEALAAAQELSRTLKEKSGVPIE